MRINLILLLLFPLFLQAQKAEPPKLVVGIVVDQMRYDYIYRYWNKYSENGFKKLVNNGMFCRNTQYNYIPTYTGPGHASIYTGTTPAVHGIIANNWYNKELKRMVYCTEDKKHQTIGCTSKAGMMSPLNLYTSTITDELRLSNVKQSKVIGIALKDRGAILPVGGTANAAFWFDNLSGGWITSSFYMNTLPGWVNKFNEERYPDKYINQGWKTLLPVDQYIESIKDDNHYEGLFPGETKPVFPHEIQKDEDKYESFRYMPHANTFTKDFAITAIKNENLGKGNVTDFIAISFSSTDYIGHMFGPSSLEIEDTYLRLDKDIADLITYLEKEIGKQNFILFLTADHAAAEVPQYLSDMNISSGYIDYKRMLTEMRSMLWKKYNDSIISTYYNQQVYLDEHALLKHAGKKDEIKNDIINYLVKQQGVSSAFASDYYSSPFQAQGIHSFLQKGFNPLRSGDILVNYQPGYIDLYGSKTGTTHGSAFSYDTHVPLIWYGNNIRAGEYNEPVMITDIAPTLSLLLNISFPNGCTGKPIPAVLK